MRRRLCGVVGLLLRSCAREVAQIACLENAKKLAQFFKAQRTALCRMAFAASSVANVTMHNRFTCAVCEGKKL